MSRHHWIMGNQIVAMILMCSCNSNQEPLSSTDIDAAPELGNVQYYESLCGKEHEYFDPGHYAQGMEMETILAATRIASLALPEQSPLRDSPVCFVLIGEKLVEQWLRTEDPDEKERLAAHLDNLLAHLCQNINLSGFDLAFVSVQSKAAAAGIPLKNRKCVEATGAAHGRAGI